MNGISIGISVVFDAVLDAGDYVGTYIGTGIDTSVGVRVSVSAMKPLRCGGGSDSEEIIFSISILNSYYLSLQKSSFVPTT